ncbi:hemopexin [Nelusetta ayraudi]|uniref:hemopexin n=1 Tax=Nelusetta ayraudi TaxID=303726 RepID=UPI003F70F899
MELFTKTLFLCLALAMTHGAPVQDAPVGDGDASSALPDRCDGIEFDAITPDEKGITFFFKGPYLWRGFRGSAQLSNESFKELDDILNGHVDAAFRMHNPDNPDHDHIYFFMADKVYSYYDHVLEDGYPKTIQEGFPGVPTHLDAAVECPRGECMADSVLFFKGNNVHVYDISTKVVKTKTWSHLPVCTSAFRWLEHYYCFHGNNFTRFHPVTGHVNGTYPKDARNYFMACPNRGHGGGYTTPKCSEVELDAITIDDTGKSYFFKGPIYMRLDTHRDGRHAFPITRSWAEITSGVDAVFSFSDKMYMIKDDKVYIYKTGAHYTLVQGYPKTLSEELGIEGPVDAAFVCPNENIVHIIKGQDLFDVNLRVSPRSATAGLLLPLSNIDAALCGPEGIRLFRGSMYYEYETVLLLTTSRIAPIAMPVTSAMLGCRDEE